MRARSLGSGQVAEQEFGLEDAAGLTALSIHRRLFADNLADKKYLGYQMAPGPICRFMGRIKRRPYPSEPSH